MTTPDEAFASAAGIEALADQLSAAADVLHARVMKELRVFKDEPISEAAQASARIMLDNEALLRQRANGLYADAAILIVSSLGVSQQHLLALTAKAAEQIRKIGMIKSATGLVAGLLALAGAAASAQPAAIVLAIEGLSKQIKLVEAHRPKRSA